jgi:hypothetical protein
VNIVTEQLGILGSSLGGLISCYAGYTRNSMYAFYLTVVFDRYCFEFFFPSFTSSDVILLSYGRAGCMSSSFWWNKEDFTTTVMPGNPYEPSFSHAAAHRLRFCSTPTALTVYLDSGNAGPSHDDDKQTLNVTMHFSVQAPTSYVFIR